MIFMIQTEYRVLCNEFNTQGSLWYRQNIDSCAMNLTHNDLYGTDRI